MGVSGKASIEAVADVSRFAAQLKRDLDKALKGIRIDADPLGDQLARSIRRGVDDANRELGRIGEGTDVVTTRIGDEHERASRRVSSSWSGVGDMMGDVGARIGSSLTSLTRVGAIGTLAAASAGQILGLAGTLSQVSGLMVAMPAALGVGIAAIGALTIATSGMGEAMAAAATGDAKALDKAMEGLSPRAQELVREVGEIAPLLGAVKDAAQDAFSSRIQGTIRTMAVLYAGPLKAGIAGIATEYGRAAASAMAFFRDGQTVSAVSSVMDTTRISIGNVAVAIDPLLAGFRDLSTIALPLLEDLSAVIGTVGTQFGQWLSQMATSGAASEALTTAVGVLRQLMTILGNVGSIVGSVLSAATASGGGLLASLAALTGQLAMFLRSAEGSRILTDVFGTLATISSSLSPVIATLLPAIGTVLVALGQGITAIVPALAPIAQVVASILVALAPILPVVGQLIGMLAGPLATAVGAFAGLLGPVIGALAPILLQVGQTVAGILGPAMTTLSQIFIQIGPPIGRLITAVGGALGPILTSMGTIVTSLFAAMEPLIPVFVSLIDPITQIIVAITPLLTLTAGLLAVLIPLLVPVIQLAAAFLAMLAANVIVPILTGLADILTWLLTPIQSLVGWLGSMSTALSGVDWGGVGSSIMSGLGAALSWLWGVLQTVGGAIMWLWNTVAVPAFAAISAAIGVVVGAATWLWGIFGPIVIAIGELLWSLWSGAFSVVSALIGTALDVLGAVLGAFWTVFKTIVTAIGAALYLVWTATIAPVLSMIGAAFMAVWTNWISPALSWVGDKVTWLWEGVKAAFAAIADWVGQKISVVVATATRIAEFTRAVIAAFASMVDSVRSRIDAVASFVSSIPGRITSAVGNLGSLLYNAGSNVINGLIDGISSKISALKRKIGDAARAIRDALPFSPAKWGPLSGAGDPTIAGGKIVDMVASGIVDNLATLRAASSAMAGTAGLGVGADLGTTATLTDLKPGSGTVVTFEAGAIQVTFTGPGAPTDTAVAAVGEAIGRKVADTIARAEIRTTVRTR